MTDLPTAFVDRVRSQLNDADALLATLDGPRVHGLRLDPRKTTRERLQPALGIALTPVPWCDTSFVVPGEASLGAHPLHTAGAFYLQEPSASLPVEVLDPQPDDYVLDVCAAPGGKSTQIAAALGPHGVLVSNDVTAKRARALVGTLDRWGTNAVVTTNAAAQLRGKWEGAFDRVLVDAPCSGEGMFRREPDARLHWSAAAVAGCAVRQHELIEAAAAMVRPGGVLVYSTCTFAPEENEAVVTAFLRTHSGWSVEPAPAREGVDVDTDGFARVWPHHGPGEGQFIARLRAPGDERRRDVAGPTGREVGRLAQDVVAWREFAGSHLDSWEPRGQFVVAGKSLYCAPEIDTRGLAVLRPGLPLGQALPGRFEPSAALAHALSATNRAAGTRVELRGDDLARYARGEAVAGVHASGWVIVETDGCALGWGRVRDATMRSMFPKAWRSWVNVR